MKLRLETKHFNELNINELHNILKLRSEVFVMEQDCVYLDIDGLDTDNFHFMGYVDDKLVAYTRTLKPGDRYNEICISRVCNDIKFRNRGFGNQIMEYTIQKAFDIYLNCDTIRISAQCYLEKFYNELGFASTDKTYLEDGIPHLEMFMKRTKKSTT